MEKNILVLFLMTFFSFQYSFADDIDEIKNKAEKGDAVAQCELAIYYLNNESTNYIDVLHLLRESSKQGNNMAKRLLSDLTSSGHEKWGDFSQELYNSYDYGALSNEDKEILEEWATKGCGSSSCKGHKGYLLVLAHSYYHEKNYNKALEFYNKALSQMKKDNLGENDKDGEPFDLISAWKNATHMIGYFYENGFGVKQDFNEAINYYLMWIDPSIYSVSSSRRKEIVLSFGNTELIEANEKGEHDGKNIYDEKEFPSENYYWIHRAVYVMIKSFQYAKACTFYDVVSTDEEEEWREFPDPVSFFYIGELYYKGLGVKKNYERAFWYFEYITEEMPDSYNMNISVEFRDINNYPSIYADACYCLYECYAYGRGTQKNNEKAEWYFRRALRFGSPSAMYDDQKRYEITEQ